MANFYGATSLIGGVSGSLDSIDGNSLVNGDGAVVISSTSVYIYTLNATSGSLESSPNVISPDSNAGSKRWILIDMVSAGVSLSDITLNAISSLTAASNTDIDTGTETVDSFADTLGDGCVWHYIVKNGANLRTGTVMAAWDASGDTVAYSEMSSGDVGTTSGLVLSVDISSNTVRLRATAGSNDWSVKVTRILM